VTSLLAPPTERRVPVRRKRILAWPNYLRLNPMLGMLHDHMERSFGWRVARFNYLRGVIGRYTILHISFPSVIFRNPSLAITLARYILALASIRVAKLLGRRVVWTVHNLADHDAYHPRLEARFMDRFADLLDLAVHMSAAGRDAAEARYPRLARKPSAIIPHPHYGGTIGERMSREAALAVLGLPPDCKLILAFGVIRRYKNLLKLIRGFNDMPNGNSRLLLIAGSPLDAELAGAMPRVAGTGRVTFMLRDIDESEFAILFGAATLVVAPYLDILNSGTAFMSLSHARPILVSNRGAMKELKDQVGADWIKLFDAPLTPLVLGDALHWAAPPRRTPPDLNPFAPERVAASYDRAFDNLI
jgi:beta-1,4-mannosyltransferase